MNPYSIPKITVAGKWKLEQRKCYPVNRLLWFTVLKQKLLSWIKRSPITFCYLVSIFFLVIIDTLKGMPALQTPKVDFIEHI